MNVNKIIKVTRLLAITLLVTTGLTVIHGQNPSDCILEIPFEKDSNQSVTYTEMLSFYYNAAQCSELMKFTSFGRTDIGKPLHVLIIDAKKEFEPLSESDDRSVLLINNGIHPGEPCGIDASMLFVKNLILDKKRGKLLDDIVILIVPSYNIGGMLNRSSYSRANQNGPESYGFRGNAKNLDLNRDFIKADSRNTQTLWSLFAKWDPDFFLDTHTTNGADYPYTMTYIANMQNRLAPSLQKLTYEEMIPQLLVQMKDVGWEMCPYVHARTTPDEGMAAFNDLPRYSMGYAALRHTPAITTEAHMFKPFKDRVQATYHFIALLSQYVADNRKEIKASRKASLLYYSALDSIALSFTLDTQLIGSINFKGYRPKKSVSEVTGQLRLKYDRTDTFVSAVPYYMTYQPLQRAAIPKAYVLPQAYIEVIERLRMNGVDMRRVERDSTVTSLSYRIADYKSRTSPYEGHFKHDDVQVALETIPFRMIRGDYIVTTDQPLRRLIVETLEPQAPDSYFSWNFFDGILMQKEYFSSYVFEDEAARLLRSDAALRRAFDQKKIGDPDFAKNAYRQLDFIYKSSPYYEKTHNLYPVGRLFD